MTASGPWYISAHAIRQYLAICGRPDNEAEFSRAECELIDLAREVVRSARTPKRLDGGLLQYRGPAPLRLRLRVATNQRAGDRSPLVAILPDHDNAPVRRAVERDSAWKLSDAAIEDYLRLRRMDQRDSRTDRDALIAELRDTCEGLELLKEGRPRDDGCLVYRGPKSRRYQYVVNVSGAKPVLTQVRPESDRRVQGSCGTLASEKHRRAIRRAGR